MGYGGLYLSLTPVLIYHAQKLNVLLLSLFVSSETTNSNSLLPNTASDDIQQHVFTNSGDVDNDSKSDCHFDLDSCAPEVMGPDARVFSSIKNEQKYPWAWLYASVVHQGYLCKFCEPFCGHSSSSQEIGTVGINLGIVWSLFY